LIWVDDRVIRGCQAADKSGSARGSLVPIDHKEGTGEAPIETIETASDHACLVISPFTQFIVHRCARSEPRAARKAAGHGTRRAVCGMGRKTAGGSRGGEKDGGQWPSESVGFGEGEQKSGRRGLREQHGSPSTARRLGCTRHVAQPHLHRPRRPRSTSWAGTLACRRKSWGRWAQDVEVTRCFSTRPGSSSRAEYAVVSTLLRLSCFPSAPRHMSRRPRRPSSSAVLSSHQRSCFHASAQGFPTSLESVGPQPHPGPLAGHPGCDPCLPR
jgi:hypothetical protein